MVWLMFSMWKNAIALSQIWALKFKLLFKITVSLSTFANKPENDIIWKSSYKWVLPNLLCLTTACHNSWLSLGTFTDGNLFGGYSCCTCNRCCVRNLGDLLVAGRGKHVLSRCASPSFTYLNILILFCVQTTWDCEI